MSEKLDIQESVVLLHGLMNSHHYMNSMQRALELAGYHVINIDYPSTRYNIEQLIPIIQNEITAKTDHSRKINYVGFSLGGLLARILAGLHRPENMGRMVQLASPNQGSEVADFWQDNWLFRSLYGPAAKDIRTDQSTIEHLFKPINYELGIIAGSAHLAPISTRLFPGINDGRVSVERSKVDGMKDHIVVHANHPFFPHYKIVQNQTVQFLRHGHFLKESTSRVDK